MASISNNRDPSYYRQFLEDLQRVVQEYQEELGFAPEVRNKPIDTTILVDALWERLSALRHKEHWEPAAASIVEGRTWTFDPGFLRRRSFERAVFDAIGERITEINETAYTGLQGPRLFSRCSTFPITSHNLAERLGQEIPVLFPQPKQPSHPGMVERIIQSHTPEQLAIDQERNECNYVCSLARKEAKTDYVRDQARSALDQAQLKAAHKAAADDAMAIVDALCKQLLEEELPGAIAEAAHRREGLLIDGAGREEIPLVPLADSKGDGASTSIEEESAAVKPGRERSHSEPLPSTDSGVGEDSLSGSMFTELRASTVVLDDSREFVPIG